MATLVVKTAIPEPFTYIGNLYVSAFDYDKKHKKIHIKITRSKFQQVLTLDDKEWKDLVESVEKAKTHPKKGGRGLSLKES